MVKKNNILLISKPTNKNNKTIKNEIKVNDINKKINFIVYNKPKIAILFSGLHYFENYKHWSGKIYDIDFRSVYATLLKNKYDFDPTLINIKNQTIKDLF